MTLLFVGRSTLDLGYVCPRFPAEDEKLSAMHTYVVGGGPALNAALAACVLGSRVRLLTLLGGGPFAATVREELARYDVPVIDFAEKDAEVLPVSSIVIVPESGSRTVIDQQPAQAIGKDVDPARLLDGIDLVLTDGFLPELAVPLCRLAQRRHIPVVLDGGSWKPWTAQIVSHVDLAIVSERFRPGGHETDDLLSAIHAMGPTRVAVTRGERPISWCNVYRRGEIVPPRVEAIDTLGAGDIFHGAFCHFLCAGNDFPKALRLASEVAAESCRHFGTRGWIEELGA